MSTEQAFTSAYDQYSESILRHIYFRVSNHSKAEDLTQETFFKAWRYIANGEKVANLKAFFYQVANNLVIDYYRVKHKEIAPLENISEADVALRPDEDDKIDQTIDRELIKKSLTELSDDYRQVLLLRYIDDLSVKEIAKITDKTTSNVSVMIHRGLKILKKSEILKKRKVMEMAALLLGFFFKMFF